MRHVILIVHEYANDAPIISP